LHVYAHREDLAEVKGVVGPHDTLVDAGGHDDAHHARGAAVLGLLLEHGGERRGSNNPGEEDDLHKRKTKPTSDFMVIISFFSQHT
jgi:hypothetical protein